jgi:hypothetical protein
LREQRGRSDDVARALEICRFELRLQLATFSNYFFFLVFAGLGMLVTLIFGSSLQEAALHTEVPHLANAPFVVTFATYSLGPLALFSLSGGLFGRSATRDFDAGSFPILLTSGLNEREYVLGRLVAATCVALAISMGIVVGLVGGLALPSIVPSHVGPLQWQTYAIPVLVYLVPNTLIAGVLLFAVGLLSRRAVLVYLALPVALSAVGFAAGSAQGSGAVGSSTRSVRWLSTFSSGRRWKRTRWPCRSPSSSSPTGCCGRLSRSSEPGF